MIETPICPDCGAEMALGTTTKFQYPSGQDRKFWGCSRFPDCSATHGAHPDGRPLGRPGTREEKLARMEAHRAFDPLWKEHGLTQKEAYAFLAEGLGLTKEACHIGMFDVATCQRVVALCTDWKGR